MAENKNLLNFNCELCKKKFVHKASLKRHLHHVHPDKRGYIDSLATWKSYKYVCSCGRRFNQSSNFRSHERKIHNISSPPVYKNTRKCPLCSSSLENENSMRHFQDKHSLKIESERLTFDTFEEFKHWKENIEKETMSIFTKTTGSQLSGDNKKFYFGCHRSGYFRPKGQGMRRLKTQGSRKIDGFCPASILVIQTKDSKCEVKFTKTHVGHRNSLHHIDLSNSERQSVAEKVVANVPFDTILAEMRNAETVTSNNRVNLLKKKDLFNIKKSLNNLLGTFKEKIPKEDDDKLDVQPSVLVLSDNDNSFGEMQVPVRQLSCDNDTTTASSSFSLDMEKEVIIKDVTAFVNSLSTKAEINTVQQVFISLKSSLGIVRENYDNFNITEQNLGSQEDDNSNNRIKIEILDINTSKEKILTLSNF